MNDSHVTSECSARSVDAGRQARSSSSDLGQSLGN